MTDEVIGNGHWRTYLTRLIWAVLTAGAVWLSAKSGSLTLEVYGLPPRVKYLEATIKQSSEAETKAHEETNRLLRELLSRQPAPSPSPRR